METTTIPSLLQRHGLRNTNARQDVLRFFLEQESAVSHGEIEQVMGQKFDRVTLYRTLKSFEKSGLIHKVPDDGAVVKYAACAHTCDTHKHHDDHIHFKCEQCQQTVCLNDIHIELPTLPEGYQTNDFQILVTGTCPSCQQ
ncbi:MAG: transcriptional repressor [Bacteroidota bacterium]